MPPRKSPAKSATEPIYLTTAQVAKHYGVSPGRIRQVICQRQLVPDRSYSGTSLWLPSRLAELAPRSGQAARRET